LTNYSLQIKKDSIKKLRLTDRIEVKKQLKEKILREIEGFRNTGKDFTLLNKVSKEDLNRIFNKIKVRLLN
jgi:hypothetical protein